MFTTLFQRPTVISRYRAGPLAEERERFLMQCEARGYSRSMLQKIAWILLAVAHCIPIDHGKVNRRDIEQAVEGRTRFKRRPDGAQDSESSRRLFVHFTTEWARSLGRLELYWFSVKMTARLDVNATPGGRMSPIAPGIVPECSGASRVKRAARAGFAALDAPCALWYSMLVGERERSGAPGIRVFMRAPCSHGAHAAASEPARVCGLAPTISGWPCHP